MLIALFYGFVIFLLRLKVGVWDGTRKSPGGVQGKGPVEDPGDEVPQAELL